MKLGTCNSLAGVVWAVIISSLLLTVLSVSTNVVVVEAFVVTPHTRTAARASSSLTFLTAEKDKSNDALEKFSNPFKDMTSNFDVSAITNKVDVSSMTKSFDISSLTDNFGDILSNLSSGELGQRGEVYVLVQAILVLCIVFGGIPLVGGIVSVVLGPGLLLAGIATMVVSLPALGPNLSPWPVPTSSTTSYLVTDEGLYAQLRHPLYAGLLATCAGLSILTGSATRLLLTAFLWYVLDLKSDFEEEELALKFPEYEQYKKDVTGKFFPQSITQLLPWSSYDEK